uniref:Uncharacterized protein n=1 Tax=Lactuca sativa TaxID=4236 RepID=A0A9R1VS22_LACSA|nr:hypothetical protein LSAT_V11C400179240 [Lactuca sativa]
MTPTEIRELIEKLAIESKHSGNEDEWYPYQPRGVKEISNTHLESQISKLTKAVLLLMKEKIAAKKPCCICLKTEHPTYMCPLLQLLEAIIIITRIIFSRSTNIRSHPDFISMKSLAMRTQAFQTETRASIKNLEQQVSQLATSVGRLESQEKLPEHTENNPKHNMSVISLRSGKTYGGQAYQNQKTKLMRNLKKF